MSEPNASRESLLDRFDRAGDTVRNSIEELTQEDLNRTMVSGWTPQEMLGHLAFWMECTKPVLIGILRGDAQAIAGWRFGSGYIGDETQLWPTDDVHNSREGSWARQQPLAAVVVRLGQASHIVRSVIEALTDEEAHNPRFVDYLDGSVRHVEEHAVELTSAKI